MTKITLLSQNRILKNVHRVHIWASLSIQHFMIFVSCLLLQLPSQRETIRKRQVVNIHLGQVVGLHCEHLAARWLNQQSVRESFMRYRFMTTVQHFQKTRYRFPLSQLQPACSLISRRQLPKPPCQMVLIKELYLASSNWIIASPYISIIERHDPLTALTD